MEKQLYENGCQGIKWKISFIKGMQGFIKSVFRVVQNQFKTIDLFLHETNMFGFHIISNNLNVPQSSVNKMAGDRPL